MRVALGVMVAAMVAGCALKGPKKIGDAPNDAAGGSDGGAGGESSSVTSPSATTTTGTGGTGGAGIGGAGGTDIEEPLGGNGQMPPQTPVYRIPLRIHRGDSGMGPTELGDVLEEMQWIWWSQAAICFEIEVVDHDDTMNVGYDLWFVTDPKSGNYNGYYNGDHDIWTIDQPSLGSAPNPTEHPASRTSAHELGHGLNLSHYNNQPDSDDALMSSGKRGWELHDFEIDTARNRAAAKAIDDLTPIYCTPIDVPQ